VILRVARFAELDTATLYAILRLRVDVFVVEQRSAYPDLDGRDDEPGTRHVWLDDHGPRA
jgi:ElaA protein